MMDMEESPEEFTGSNDHLHRHHGHIPIKGKRTKRHRPSSPFYIPAMTTSTSSSGGDVSGNGSDKLSSLSLTGDDLNYESTTEEEENMANCLILLAQSGGADFGGRKRRIGSRKFTDGSSAAEVGLYGYDCKTCNRTFSSFQALGGHRASHGKPKSIIAEEKKSLITPPHTPPQFKHDRSYEDDQLRKLNNEITIVPNFTTSTTLSLVHGSNHRHKSVSKVHECSICDSKFSSGQALGGHMRRHRTLTSAQISAPVKIEKRRNVLQLDLNLPAPDDDLDGKFQLPVVFSSPAMVDCHY